MDYAIVEIAGKQYKAELGKTLTVDKLPQAEGEKVTFSNVLVHQAGDKITAGTPTVAGVSVVAKVVKHTKAKKIHILRFKAKSHYHKARGHRAQMSQVFVESIG